MGRPGTASMVEAKYPALRFKQQFTAQVEKIYGIMRDNLKKEINPFLTTGMFGTAPLERLLCFLLENGSSRKMLGRTPQEPEPEPRMSPAKQALCAYRYIN
jgi:hypothetical protein